MFDHLGLISDLDHLRPTPAQETTPTPPQESYVLAAIGRGQCGHCRQIADLVLVVGIPNLAVCHACDPLERATDVINASFDDEAEVGWVFD